MGSFRLEFQAVGGHGCQREIKDGGTVYGCGRFGCPDCLCRDFVRDMIARGYQVEGAVLRHWPGQPSEVQDDLVSKKRKGQF